MLTVYESQEGLLTRGGGGGGGGGGVTEDWVKNRFVPLKPWTETTSDPIKHQVANTEGSVLLKCVNGTTGTTNSVQVKEGELVLASEINNGDATVLEFKPEAIRYRRKTGSTTITDELVAKVTSSDNSITVARQPDGSLDLQLTKASEGIAGIRSTDGSIDVELDDNNVANLRIAEGVVRKITSEDQSITVTKKANETWDLAAVGGGGGISSITSSDASLEVDKSGSTVDIKLKDAYVPMTAGVVDVNVSTITNSDERIELKNVKDEGVLAMPTTLALSANGMEFKTKNGAIGTERSVKWVTWQGSNTIEYNEFISESFWSSAFHGIVHTRDFSQGREDHMVKMGENPAVLLYSAALVNTVPTLTVNGNVIANNLVTGITSTNQSVAITKGSDGVYDLSVSGGGGGITSITSSDYTLDVRTSGSSVDIKMKNDYVKKYYLTSGALYQNLIDIGSDNDDHSLILQRESFTGYGGVALQLADSTVKIDGAQAGVSWKYIDNSTNYIDTYHRINLKEYYLYSNEEPSKSTRYFLQDYSNYDAQLLFHEADHDTDTLIHQSSVVGGMPIFEVDGIVKSRSIVTSTLVNPDDDTLSLNFQNVKIGDSTTMYTLQADGTTLNIQYSGVDQTRTVFNPNTSKCDFTVFGIVHADNINNMTVTHNTNVYTAQPARFCEMTGEVYDGYKKIGITDCISKVKLATTLTTKIIGIITDNDNFASHGDVMVQVDDGEYKIGDLLVPTATGARVANEEEKLFIMINGLPRVRVTCVDGGILPKINDCVCVACFVN